MSPEDESPGLSRSALAAGVASALLLGSALLFLTMAEPGTPPPTGDVPDDPTADPPDEEPPPTHEAPPGTDNGSGDAPPEDEGVVSIEFDAGGDDGASDTKDEDRDKDNEPRRGPPPWAGQGRGGPD